ncbi:MAG: alpha/beta hydrolase [Chitinophaga sp.]|jgi:pimeloyl-ACP methyl ester carboxylesterase|nr:alpha/beta hydrolase [Chitinophaga sp.]
MRSKKVYIPLTLLVAWLLFASGCMKMRMSDAVAKTEFDKANVAIQFHTFKIKGNSLHYAVTGLDTLPTLFFVHGSPGSWDAFKEYLKDSLLLTKFRMIAIDRPGFGYSNFGDAVNLQQQAAIISPLLIKINNKKPFFLVGHSLGGPLVIKLAADNPDLFSGIIVLAGSIDTHQEPKEYWRSLFINNPLKFLLPGAFRPSNAELWYLKKDLQLLQNDFSKVTCPVYFVHGDKDQFVAYGNMAFGAQALINAEKIDTITIHNANHFIPWQHKAEIENLLYHLY